MNPGLRACLCAGALLLLPACAVVPEEAPAPDAVPDYLPRREVENYERMRNIILDDGPQRWIVTPQALLEFTNGFLTFEYGSDEGLLGSILSIMQDSQRLWIGTSRALQTLDKSLHYVRTHLEDPDLQAVSLFLYASDRCVAVTALGIVFVDAGSLTQEVYPLDGFSIREVNDVAFFEGDLWIATSRGLYRFSTTWKSWNQSYGSKMLKRLNVLRLVRTDQQEGRQTGPASLYAVTMRELFIYRPAFDNWERLGL